MLSSIIQAKMLKIIPLTIVMGLFIAAFNFAPFKELFYTLIFWTEGLINSQPLLGAFVFIFLSGFSAMFAFASNVALVPSAILVWGVPLTFFLLLTGWLIGAITAYFIGLGLARPAISAFMNREKRTHYEHFITEKTSFWIILLFCLAVPSEVPGYVLGTVRYPFFRFIVAMAIAESVSGLAILLIAQNILDQSIVSGAILIIAFAFLFGTASAVFLFLQKRRGHLE